MKHPYYLTVLQTAVDYYAHLTDIDASFDLQNTSVFTVRSFHGYETRNCNHFFVGLEPLIGVFMSLYLCFDLTAILLESMVYTVSDPGIESPERFFFCLKLPLGHFISPSGNG